MTLNPRSILGGSPERSASGGLTAVHAQDLRVTVVVTIHVGSSSPARSRTM